MSYPTAAFSWHDISNLLMWFPLSGDFLGLFLAVTIKVIHAYESWIMSASRLLLPVVNQCSSFSNQLLMSVHDDSDSSRCTDTRRWGLPDRARPLVMHGHPEEQPVLSRCREAAACVSEEDRSFRDRERKKLIALKINFPTIMPPE